MKNYIVTLIVVSANLLIRTNFIVYFLPLSIAITTFLLLFIFLVLNHYGILFKFNSKASIFPAFTSYIFYFSIIIISFLTIVLEYTIKLINIYFNNSLSSKLMLEREKNSRRKSFFGMSTKSFSRHSKEKRRNSLPIEDRSKSNLASQDPNKLKFNLNNNDKTPKSKNNSNNIIKDFKNDFNLDQDINGNNNNDINDEDENESEIEI